MTSQLDILVQQWTSVGVLFNTAPTNGEIDLERLLIDTARNTDRMARLFVMSATWLHTYGDLIAKHRLKRLIRDELQPEYQPVLGLLLDIAQQGTHPLKFETIIKTLKPAKQPKAMFASSRKNPKLRDLAKCKASSISQKWNLWCQPIEFKDDAIRPASWLMRRHPEFVTRADFRGDLRASILASLRFDSDAGHSELRLAELAGGSRAQLRSALGNLEMTGRVITRKADGANRREVILTRVG
ncbi:MAG: hypothetical protein JKX70_12170 [Phycisphaerales bacterium]|nr:hypothetical protein [Phycisphaerales bacterium]